MRSKGRRMALDRLRRATVLAVVVLLVVPGVALAAFRGTASASLPVGTVRLEAPTDATSAWTCPALFGVVKPGSVTVSSYSPSPRADGYRVELFRNGRLASTRSSDSPDRVSFSFSQAGTYTVMLTVSVKNWTATTQVGGAKECSGWL